MQESLNSGTFYVVGSLSSPQKIPLAEAKVLIQNALPKDYTAVDFYEAEEEKETNRKRLSLIRDDENFFEVSL